MRYKEFGQKIIFVFSLGLFSHAYGHGNDTLTIFVDSNYPPYMHALEGTAADGLYPRLLQKILDQTGQKVEIKAYPWKRALMHSAEGKGAVAGAYKNNERLKIYDYSKPLYQEKLVIFVNKNNPFEFNSIEDLKGKVVGVNRGWSYGQEFDDARANNLFDVSIRNQPNENFTMLALGRIDCLILDEQSGESFIQILGLEDKVVSLSHAFSVNDGHLIVPKTLKKEAFLSEFNAALEKIQKDGTYNSIVQAYIEGTLPE